MKEGRKEGKDLIIIILNLTGNAGAWKTSNENPEADSEEKVPPAAGNESHGVQPDRSDPGESLHLIQLLHLKILLK